MLDFRMHTFIKLSNTLNYTKAAKELCMTQPSVTQHIKYLEQYYQVKLFENENKQLHLTKAGRILQQHILTMASDERKLAKMISASIETLDQVRFGATRTIGEYFLPSKLSTFLCKHPDTSITMIVENTKTLLDMLQDGTIDFAFVEGYFAKQAVSYECISKERFIAVKSPDYTLSCPITTLNSLRQETLILREKGSGTREIFERILHEQNSSVNDFKRTMEIGNIHAIKQLVLQGHGITFLYEAAVLEELQNKTLEILELQDFHIQREFNFITLKNSIFHDVYQSFLDELIKGLTADAK